MSLLRFTNPTDIAAYQDYAFPVLAAKIVLRAEDMAAVYAAYLDNHTRYFKNIPKEWGRYREAERVTQLYALLTQAITVGQDVELDGHDSVWSFCSGLMFNKQFVRVSCPACERDYAPSDCAVLQWTLGRDLAATWGRRVVCPVNHTLYSCSEGNS